jgi:hypothetical protein
MQRHLCGGEAGGSGRFWDASGMVPDVEEFNVKYVL